MVYSLIIVSLQTNDPPNHLSIALSINPAATPAATPTTIPPMISVGKCTYRYILENAMRIAITQDIAPSSFFLLMNNAVTAANDAAVCPDGKE